VMFATLMPVVAMVFAELQTGLQPSVFALAATVTNIIISPAAGSTGMAMLMFSIVQIPTPMATATAESDNFQFYS